MTAVYCPACGSLMGLQRSRYGEFFGCLRWPDCRETVDALNREPYELYFDLWMARPWDGRTLPPWALRLAAQRVQMIQRLESVRNTFSAVEWEDLIGSVVICSAGGKVAVGKQRHRVELIVSERRGR